MAIQPKSARECRWRRTLLLGLLVLARARPLRAGTTGLPGIGDGSITPETLFAFNASVKMIPPPPGLPQKWFSAEAEVVETVASATTTHVFVVEPMAHSHAGRKVRISGSSAASGQISQIVSNSSNEIEVTPPFEVPPAAGDLVEVFTGDLPPGRWDGACTETDPCLDYYQVHLLGQAGPVWIWLDAGDVWDSDDEWCDRTHRPPDSCPDPAQNRFFAKEIREEGIENDIFWGISSTDLTGQVFPVLDCDASSNYPKAAGGVFENQNGSSFPSALDGPSAWMVVQGIETRCWSRPAPGSAISFNEWGEGTGIYRQEYSGKILAIHNRHGDLWDGATLVSGNGTNFTHGDRYVGGVILVDIQANTADYTPMVGQCTATNTPYRSCQGTDFTGQGRGQFGDLWPRFITANGGGNVLWIGGDSPNRNKSGQGSYTSVLRNFIEVGGFRDYFSSSGVGGTQHVTLVNLQLAGAANDPTAPAVVMVVPIPGRWGTKYEVRILNSRFTDMPDRAPIVDFSPGWTTDQATETSLRMEWSDVDVERYGSVFLKDHSVVDGAEIDGGFDWVGRCLFVDEAHPTPGDRILDVRSGIESLATRCRRHFLDLEGWIDGDDVPYEFGLCSEDVASYASDIMAGTMMQPGNAGGLNGWQIFARNSGDWGGEGVNIDARALLETSPEVQDAVLGACHHAQTYALGQTLPIGFISTPDNLISRIRLHGFRNLGFNARGDWPPCTPPAEELSITDMALDNTDEAIIHYADPNQPGGVTGYNVYRASAPAGPWILLDSNVQDVDPGTPGLQYVDATGDVSAIWYYQVTAFNQACRAEGPW